MPRSRALPILTLRQLVSASCSSTRATLAFLVARDSPHRVLHLCRVHQHLLHREIIQQGVCTRTQQLNSSQLLDLDHDSCSIAHADQALCLPTGSKSRL